jgi:uncharacterized protein YdiU (UPF0061 family)
MFGKSYSDFEEWTIKYLERVGRESSSEAERVAMMKSANPLIVPRNYFLQRIIDQVEAKV